ncbi:hypothetical protein MPTK1_1g02750 [Marchantia polymorpha subsp. ruderalis]|uniref:Haloacid dehalogenase-like hydrolase domain-containing protein 3 n=2 Tax=Marchantia polymorpha TaxID=3197 RepID=A0A176VGQ8_MARPO|nr:hypothetical protein AXG93_2584s1240 [Marchantia polymorpha subsp. ruderalis]PTQ31285.1 hypothetical protein MARPO_0113s0023 [Marchantia polymorpha]BBM97063.1 hypothetical protein Mp_1g02750 [Marchantia polymorpha subsp. ruderalis]|eukprot:PTQ31285.1 hypothetical protein MARPO_0113s0023 [Marchantia polymorpha]
MKPTIAKLAGPIAQQTLSNLKCVTVDVTGTLIAYKGSLGDYYCLAAKRVGLPCPDYDRMHEGFKVAYKEMAQTHPCFGNAANMPNIEWWRTVVHNSFLKAGYEYDNKTLEKIFMRIYRTFGSATPYTLLPDAKPFLQWIRKQGIVVGVVSNAEHRYRDVILPTLGLNQGSEWDFGVFSGIDGVEKPNPRIYELAMERAGVQNPDEVLHVGDSYKKDYLPAKSLGMHAVLLDRFKTVESKTWKENGATVFPDLIEVEKWIHGKWGITPEERCAQVAAEADNQIPPSAEAASA